MQNRRDRTGQAKWDRRNRTFTAEQADQDRKNRAGRTGHTTGKTEPDMENREDRTLLEEQKSQNGTVRTGKTERDRQNRIFRYTVLKTVCFLVLFSVTNIFGDCFKTVRFCYMTCTIKRTYHLMNVLLCHAFVVTYR